MSIELGMTPEEILDEYLRKNQIKKERQEKGYDAVDINLDYLSYTSDNGYHSSFANGCI
jgi:hypothetical protein